MPTNTSTIMDKTVNEILTECDAILKNCEASLREDKAMNKGIDFLINEYKTNKRYFREDGGKVTIEDIIRTTYQFAWASKGNYDLHPEVFD